MTITDAAEAAKKDKRFNVEVNRKPVTLDGKKQTGASIKAAAIAQGVPIQPDFLLTRLVGKKYKPVADNEQLEVKNGEDFRAVDGDDNS